MTGSEMMVEVMKRMAEQGEPDAVLVVWADPSGCVNLKTNCANTHTIGLGVYAAATALVQLIQNPEEITRTGGNKVN
jgi:hypothetical protein